MPVIDPNLLYGPVPTGMDTIKVGPATPTPSPKSMLLSTASHTIDASNYAFRSEGDVTPLYMLAMRMRWNRQELPPLEHVSVHVTKTAAIVFVVKNGKPVTLEDDPALYPSDQLITQLRVIQG